MALETATYISDLVSTNPTASDNISQGDDHIRLLKATVKATFPNITGALNPTHTMVNTWFGSGDGTGTPVDAVITAPSGSGTNIAGADVIVKAGNGTGTGGSGYISFQTAAAGSSGSTANTLAERMRIDNAGNVGIGVVPSAWDIGTALQIRNSALATSNSEINVANNAFYQNPNWKYVTTAPSARYVQFQNTHVWSYAASGTAGNNITWSEAMRIDSSGNVGIGTTSPTTYAGAKFTVYNSAPQIAIAGTASNSAQLYLLANGATATSSGVVIGQGYATATDSIAYISNNANADLLFRTNATERLRIGSSGQLGIGGANYGTSGQVLTSNGSAAAPSWQTPTSGSVTVTTYSSGSGTWTKPSTGTFARVRLWGGGGSGCKAVGTSAGSASARAGGGGGGGYIEYLYALSDLNATESYSVGAGGTAITATTITNGNPGGSTTFKSLTAYGGGGGTNSSANPNNGGSYVAAGTPSGTGFWDGASAFAGGQITTPTLAFYGGGAGGSSDIQNTSPAGTSLFAGSGGASNATVGGTAGSGTAPGGGGGGKTNNTTGSSGAGGAGRIEIWVW